MNSDSKEVRELIAKLSDGTLSAEDTVRLNDVLKGDHIAQQMYLDHMLVDGLLEREFCGIAHAVSKSPRAETAGHEGRLHTSNPVVGVTKGRRFFTWAAGSVAAVSTIVLIFVVSVLSWRAPVASEARQSVKLALTDSGLGFGTPQEAIVTSDGVWYGDAEQVSGSVSEITPLEGRHMLRFDDLSEANKNSSVIYQLVDLGGQGTKVGESDVSINASAHFNAAAVDADESRLFSLKVYAFPEKPVYVPGVEPPEWGKPLVFAGSQFVADVDEGSWQNAATHLDLTPDTRYLVIQLSIIDSDMKSKPADEPANYFVDKVALLLVTSSIIE